MLPDVAAVADVQAQLQAAQERVAKATNRYLEMLLLVMMTTTRMTMATLMTTMMVQVQ